MADTMARFNDVVMNEGLRQVLRGIQNRCFISPALAEGTNDHTIKVAAATPFIIDGVFYSKGITDNIAPTVCVVQAALKRCRYLISLNIAGTVTVTKGTEVGSLSTGALTTLSWNAADKKIMSSTSALGSFKAGDLILVSGFTANENNGIFSIDAVDKNGAWIRVNEGGASDEAAGDSVTILRESPLPECPVKQCPIGLIQITTTTGTFTVGVDDITDDAAGATIAFVNLSGMPLE